MHSGMLLLNALSLEKKYLIDNFSLYFQDCMLTLIPLYFSRFRSSFWIFRALVGVIDEYFDGYYTEEMIESQVLLNSWYM